MFIQAFLIKNLKKDLTKLLTNSSYNNKYPFPCIVPQTEQEKEIKEMLISNIQKTKSLYIKSRQDLLKSLYIDEKGQLFYHLKDGDYTSTCMGGKKESDPYYNPNTIGYNYDLNGDSFRKAVRNLNITFFNLSKNIKYKLNLEDLTIEEFENIFSSAYTLEESKDKIISFCNKLQSLIVKTECEEANKDYGLDIRMNRVFVINGKKVVSRAESGTFDDLSVGDSLFLKNEKYQVEKIDLIVNRNEYSLPYGLIYLKKH